jgi:hypothetical protein
VICMAYMTCMMYMVANVVYGINGVCGVSGVHATGVYSVCHASVSDVCDTGVHEVM